jgi:hypothetical protein
VLVLRVIGGAPMYFGPQLGWASLLVAVALVIIAVQRGSFSLLVLPAVLFAIHCGFLFRRACVHARFATELSAALASTAHAGAENISKK